MVVRNDPIHLPAEGPVLLGQRTDPDVLIDLGDVVLSIQANKSKPHTHTITHPTSYIILIHFASSGIIMYHNR